MSAAILAIVATLGLGAGSTPPLAALGRYFSTEWMYGLAATAIYAIMGMVLFAIAIWIMERIAPFSIVKEIEVDQNTALAVLMGSVIVGIAIIFAASIVG